MPTVYRISVYTCIYMYVYTVTSLQEFLVRSYYILCACVVCALYHIALINSSLNDSHSNVQSCIHAESMTHCKVLYLM